MTEPGRQSGKEAGLREALAALSPERQRLLERWVAEATGAVRSGMPVATSAGARLIACVVPAKDAGPTPAELREYARARLPDFMVPQQVAVLADIPRGAGGKVDRSRLFDLVRTPPAREAPQVAGARDAVMSTLARIWADVLGVASVGVDENFFEVGGDSLLSIRIIARAAREGIRLDAEEFFANPTVAGQAAVARAAGRTETRTGPVTGRAPLTPIQHWFFEYITADSARWNQCWLLRLDAGIDRTALERALQALLFHHDALRTRFVRTERGLEQRFEPPGRELPLTVATSHAADEVAFDAFVDEIAGRLNTSLDLAEGPLFGAALIASTRGPLLVVAAHHLVIDGLSWRIVLEDLDRMLDQVARGEAPVLPPRTTSFKTWAERLHQLANDASFPDEVAVWKGEVVADGARVPLDSEFDERSNTEAAAATVRHELDADVTRGLLTEVPQRFGAQTLDVLLAALGSAFRAWTGRTNLRLAVEGHGREALFEDVDLSRTVGWFTTVYPLDLAIGPDAVTTVRTVRDTLRRIPNHGIGYGLLRYLGDNESVRQALAAQPAAQVCFNYLGQIDQIGAPTRRLSVARDLGHVARGRSCPRAFLIEINVWVEGGRLKAEWRFGSHIHRRETIEVLAAGFAQAIVALVRSDGEAPRTVASDFPLAGVSDGELEQIAKLLDGVDGGSRPSR